MSVQAMSWVKKHSRAHGGALLCLMMIADYAHADGSNAYPSEKQLAEDCRMSERQIRRIVHELEGIGELCIDVSKGRCANRYTILMALEPGQNVLVNRSNPDKMSALQSQPGQNVLVEPGQNVLVNRSNPDISDIQPGHFPGARVNAPADPKEPIRVRKKESPKPPSGASPSPAEQQFSKAKISLPTHRPDDFRWLWRNYANPGNPEGCKKSWMSKKPNADECTEMRLKIEGLGVIPPEARSRFPALTVFINQRRWSFDVPFQGYQIWLEEQERDRKKSAGKQSVAAGLPGLIAMDIVHEPLRPVEGEGPRRHAK